MKILVRVTVVLLACGLLILGLLNKPSVQQNLFIEAGRLTYSLLGAPDSLLLGPLDTIEGTEPDLFKPTINRLTALSLDNWFSDSQTDVLLVQHRGEIVFQRYSADAGAGLNINGMSMVKNIVALLIGIAIDEGLIGSKNDSVAEYLPILAKHRHISIRDLLNHTSGIESTYEDINSTLKNEPLKRSLDQITFSENTDFRYDNINYYLLNRILTTVYAQPLNQIIAAKLWSPMGLERGAIINKTGYCCLFATAESWLALGNLYLSKGIVRGRQIVPSHWLQKMTTDRLSPKNFYVQATRSSVGNSYGYHIYSGLEVYTDYYWIEGLGLQVVMVNPKTQTIIVRLGTVPSAFKLNSIYQQASLIKQLLDILNENLN